MTPGWNTSTIYVMLFVANVRQTETACQILAETAWKPDLSDTPRDGALHVMVHSVTLLQL